MKGSLPKLLFMSGMFFSGLGTLSIYKLVNTFVTSNVNTRLMSAFVNATNPVLSHFIVKYNFLCNLIFLYQIFLEFQNKTNFRLKLFYKTL